VNLASPGPATFLLLVHNTGNSEDAYTGTIVGTAGPVTANLTGLSGQPAQSIPIFRLPGLSTGAIPLNTALTAVGEGQVMVRVTSLSNGAITSSPVAVVRTPTEGNRSPVVNAGPDQSAHVGDTVRLAPATFTDADTADTHTATIDWGDGTALAIGGVSENRGGGTAASAHVYGQSGPFTVQVCVTDNHGGIGCDTLIVTVAPPCAICDGPDVVVDAPIELDAANLAATAAVLAPFASFDGQTITIDLGHRRLLITSSGRISVLAGAKLQPRQFHRAGNHGTPDLKVVSTCELAIDESVRGELHGKLRNLTGAIETNALGGKAGDITLAFGGPITLDGGVQSFQEKLPDDPASRSGAITVQTCDGDITTGPASWIVTWGDKGSGPITIRQTNNGNIDLHGLVLNLTTSAVKRNAPPIINVITGKGAVTVDGGHLVLDEFELAGTRYDLTGGLLAMSRDASAVGGINIQASGDVSVSRNVSGLSLNRTNFAAVSTVVSSSTPHGGVIRVRALGGSIQAHDRAFQADGKADNSAALIELVAEGDISVERPTLPNAAHQPTLTVAAQAVNGVGMGGTIVLRSCQADVSVGAGAQILATGRSAPGTNRLTGKTLAIQGLVDPAPVAGPSCQVPDPLF